MSARQKWRKIHAKKTLPLMHAPLCVYYYYFEENYGSPWATWTLLINRQTYYRVIILGIDLIRVAARAQKRKRRKIRKNKEIYALYICTALQSGSEDQIDFFFRKCIWNYENTYTKIHTTIKVQFTSLCSGTVHRIHTTTNCKGNQHNFAAPSQYSNDATIRKQHL